MENTLINSNLPDLARAVVSETDLYQQRQNEILENYAKRFDIFNADFSTYKFRPHSVFNLMTGLPKPLTDRQKETLNAYQIKIEEGKQLTPKQYEDYGSLLSRKNAKPTLSSSSIKWLKSIYKEVVFNRTNEIKSMYLDKGIAVENKAIELFSEVFGVEYNKNKTRYDNEFFSGEPDIVTAEEVIDIKSSWDFTSFPMLDEEVENINYYYQLQAYMDVLGLQKSKLIYILVDTPDEIINDYKRKLSWQIGLISDELTYDLPEDLNFEIERNMKYQDIPKNARIKIFEIERNDVIIDIMHQQIKSARVFLQSLQNL